MGEEAYRVLQAPAACRSHTHARVRSLFLRGNLGGAGLCRQTVLSGYGWDAVG
jgi:hypothetical protein